MLLSIGSGIKRINLHNLDGLPELYRYMLKKYQVFTDISDDRIDKLYNGLIVRINKLANYC